MKSTKRKIAALTTAFVMAFALVAAMLPATISEAVGYNQISSVAFTFNKPDAGTVITVESFMPNIIPDVSTTTVGIKSEGQGIDKQPGGRFVTDDSTLDSSTNFEGKLENGKTYKAIIYANADNDNNYKINDDANITISNAKILDSYIDNEDFGGSGYVSGVRMLVSFTVGDAPAPDPVPVKEGDNQTVTPGSPVVISFDKEFSEFENGGAVFLDESTEPLSTDCYTATPGSTVITLLDSFTKTLPEGKHTLKVKFNDNSVGTASFIVSASANSDGSASGTSGTATSGTSSSATTTTKVAAPKTADVLPFAAIAVVFVGATAIGVIAIRRKNS